jgi:hypothetical protein
MRWTRFEDLFIALARRLDLSFGWWRLPVPIGLAVLIGMRAHLRRANLADTTVAPPFHGLPAAPPPSSTATRARTADGRGNDLHQPEMGASGTRFGRNVPLARTYPEPDARVLEPNPRLVSRELLTRTAFTPASTLNLHAAAWLQFMVHDWLSHGRSTTRPPWTVPLPHGDAWPVDPMTIPRTSPDPSRTAGDDGWPPTYTNSATHWWDGSQLYGSDAETLGRLRSGDQGMLRIDANGLLPLDAQGQDQTGVNGNWWLGLSLMHTLFSLEHNAICRQLAQHFPGWSDDELFDHARLVNAALMAKIHTVEWTPAIVAHPTVRLALRANWWGLQTERVARLVGRLSPNDVLSGIPGSRPDHHGVPYAITEEFVAVYRMHPLLPDEFSFRTVDSPAEVFACTFPELAFRHTRGVLERVSWSTALYSFGIAPPGAITLHNFPRTLQQLTDLDGQLSDLAAIDILRTRERGVPRYNEFRQLLHKPRLQRFEQLTDNPEWAAQLADVYGGDIDRVDLMIGLYAEPRPPGFGFSETAFRLFVLMASRRLKSDRFFTSDFTPEVYSAPGLAWIADNTFTSVVRRHAPQLAPVLAHVDNAFAPWPILSGGSSR